jgi:hypothetical protein
MFTGIKPVEVCKSDASGQLFDEALGGAGVAVPSCARSLRVRRHCENHDDQFRPDIAI